LEKRLPPHPEVKSQEKGERGKSNPFRNQAGSNG